MVWGHTVSQDGNYCRDACLADTVDDLLLAEVDTAGGLRA